MGAAFRGRRGRGRYAQGAAGKVGEGSPREGEACRVVSRQCVSHARRRPTARLPTRETLDADGQTHKVLLVTQSYRL